MFEETADFYDLIYEFKDYKREAEKLVYIISDHSANAHTILDVACGTGEHHKYLKQDYTIDGLDLNERFIKISQEKNPECTYHLGNMFDFNLGKTFDIVMCLFSSIGVAQTPEDLVSILKQFKNHLSETGLLIVEPWLTPDVYVPGSIHMQTVDKDEIKICRMSRSEKEGRLSILNFDYLVNEKSKTLYFKERYGLGLFTIEEYLQAFRDAGLQPEYTPEGLMNRGLFYGIHE